MRVIGYTPNRIMDAFGNDIEDTFDKDYAILKRFVEEPETLFDHKSVDNLIIKYVRRFDRGSLWLKHQDALCKLSIFRKKLPEVEVYVEEDWNRFTELSNNLMRFIANNEKYPVIDGSSNKEIELYNFVRNSKVGYYKQTLIQERIKMLESVHRWEWEIGRNPKKRRRMNAWPSRKDNTHSPAKSSSSNNTEAFIILHPEEELTPGFVSYLRTTEIYAKYKSKYDHMLSVVEYSERSKIPISPNVFNIFVDPTRKNLYEQIYIHVIDDERRIDVATYSTMNDNDKIFYELKYIYKSP